MVHIFLKRATIQCLLTPTNEFRLSILYVLCNNSEFSKEIKCNNPHFNSYLGNFVSHNFCLTLFFHLLLKAYNTISKSTMASYSLLYMFYLRPHFNTIPLLPFVLVVPHNTICTKQREPHNASKCLQ